MIGNTLCPKIGEAQWSCSKEECTCHLNIEKPMRGHITNWKKLEYSAPTKEHLGFCISGIPVGVIDFQNWIRTSLVVKFDEENMIIETLNSRYTLGDPRPS